MVLTNDMVTYCMSQPWDEDIRQDVFVRVLEHEGRPEDVNNAWLSRIYTNLKMNGFTTEKRRKELEQEAVAVLEGLQGKDDVHDPLEYLEAEQLIPELGALSPLLYNTLRDYVLGKTPEEIAEDQGVDANTIYQRIHQAKKEITNE